MALFLLKSKICKVAEPKKKLGSDPGQSELREQAYTYRRVVAARKARRSGVELWLVTLHCLVCGQPGQQHLLCDLRMPRYPTNQTDSKPFIYCVCLPMSHSLCCVWNKRDILNRLPRPFLSGFARSSTSTTHPSSHILSILYTLLAPHRTRLHKPFSSPYISNLIVVDSPR